VQRDRLNGVRVSLRLLPLIESKAETIELRFEARQPLFKALMVLIHRLAPMIHKIDRVVTSLCGRTIASRPREVGPKGSSVEEDWGHRRRACATAGPSYVVSERQRRA